MSKIILQIKNYFTQNNFGSQRAQIKKKIAKMSQENSKTNVTDIFPKPFIDIVSNLVNKIIQIM